MRRCPVTEAGEITGNLRKVSQIAHVVGKEQEYNSMKLTVNLGANSYPIYIENSILEIRQLLLHEVLHGHRERS